MIFRILKSSFARLAYAKMPKLNMLYLSITWFLKSLPNSWCGHSKSSYDYAIDREIFPSLHFGFPTDLQSSLYNTYLVPGFQSSITSINRYWNDFLTRCERRRVRRVFLRSLDLFPLFRNRIVSEKKILPPPDLVSTLLQNRIVYIGLPLGTAVTQLILSQLLYLNYKDEHLPIYIYINSPCADSAGHESDDHEGIYIVDMLKYVKCPIYTLSIGSTCGGAVLILASGDKRYSLPNSIIRLSARMHPGCGKTSQIYMRAKEVIRTRNEMCKILQAKSHISYSNMFNLLVKSALLDPQEAKRIGIIDQVLDNTKNYLSVTELLERA